VLRRFALVTLAAVLSISMLSPAVAHATIRESAASSSPTAAAPSYGDHELISALVASDLLESWLEQSQPFSSQASVLRVQESDAYRDQRVNFLTQATTLGNLVQDLEDRKSRLQVLDHDVVILDEIVQQLSSADESGALNLVDSLVADPGQGQWRGFSFDMLSSVEGRVAALATELSTSLEQSPGIQLSAEWRTSIESQWRGTRHLLERARQRTTAAEVTTLQASAQAKALIPELLTLRRSLPTEVGGLPLVTIDAYIAGAASLPADCPVDWALLGGIGRIESRHGTIDGSQVLASGNVSEDIFGPLLDGGATEREAEEARLEAEAETLRLELEAAEVQRLADEAAFEASVWGQLAREAEAAAALPVDPLRPLESTDETDADADGATAQGDDSDDGSGDDDADPSDEDGDEEPEFEGNGFAVIEDSDDGALDGNARWDRAVGPMQFIPETWAYWEADGNQDGVLDPQNLYDAAATAGRFLCHLSTRRGASPTSFVLGYNSSDAYVRAVLSSAATLGIAELPDIEALTSN